jgi:hypothetical protein
MTPCPYHKPGTDCGKRGVCPVRIVERSQNCTDLKPGQIALITAWVEA